MVDGGTAAPPIQMVKELESVKSELEGVRGELEGALGEAASERAAASEAAAARDQVWSLSSFEVSRQLLTNDLDQVSSVSLQISYLTAFTNKGLFELTRPAPFVDTGCLVVFC